MTNADVFKSWANGGEAESGNVSSRAFKSNVGVIHALYSYNTPIALRFWDGSMLSDSRKYSVTTSKHLSQALGMVDSQADMIDCRHDVFRRHCRLHGIDMSFAR